MARKSIFKSLPELKFLQQAMNDMRDALKEEFFEPNGTPTATVKYKDGSFRKKSIAGILFALDYVYISSSKKLVFGFTPEDAQPWSSIEVPYENLDTIFPSLLTVVKKIIFDSNNDSDNDSDNGKWYDPMCDGSVDDATQDTSLDEATWDEIIMILVEACKEKSIKEEKRTKEQIEAQYKNNPDYGKF